MKLISSKPFQAFIMLLFIFSCDVTEEFNDYINENPNNENPEPRDEINQLNIPNGFDFSTKQDIKVTISDNSNNVKCFMI